VLLAGHGRRPTALRRQAGCPQLKRDPLGGATLVPFTFLARISWSLADNRSLPSPAWSHGSSPQSVSRAERSASSWPSYDAM